MRQSIVIGASGMIGAHLVETLGADERQPIATYHSTPIPSGIRLDIRKRFEVAGLFSDIQPSAVYLPAALPNVDYCESHPAETYQTNVAGIKNVVQAANNAGTRVIHFSTDFIFDGENGPYDETDTANPVSEYGRQKLEAEHFISLFAENFLIIRTTVVYGWEKQGKNFVFRLIQSLRNGTSVRVPVDQIGSPTYVNNLAQIAFELGNSSLQGIINVTGPDCVSRYAFALHAAEVFGLDKGLICPVTTAELAQPARRPMKAGLKTDRVSTLTKTPVIGYREGLKLMAQELTRPISSSDK
ncbi:MAG: SDR family oxidoreductase [Chloroflexi bacterium]|nr:SDR family oxidoreductase [Chloroflexota bacterium]